MIRSKKVFSILLLLTILASTCVGLFTPKPVSALLPYDTTIVDPIVSEGISVSISGNTRTSFSTSSREWEFYYDLNPTTNVTDFVYRTRLNNDTAVWLPTIVVLPAVVHRWVWSGAGQHTTDMINNFDLYYNFTSNKVTFALLDLIPGTAHIKTLYWKGTVDDLTGIVTWIGTIQTPATWTTNPDWPVANSVPDIMPPAQINIGQVGGYDYITYTARLGQIPRLYVNRNTVNTGIWTPLTSDVDIIDSGVWWPIKVQIAPVIVPINTTSAMALWQEYGAAPSTLWYKIYDSITDTWGTSTQITNANITGFYYWSVSSDPYTGVVSLVWNVYATANVHYSGWQSGTWNTTQDVWVNGYGHDYLQFPVVTSNIGENRITIFTIGVDPGSGDTLINEIDGIPASAFWYSPFLLTTDNNATTYAASTPEQVPGGLYASIYWPTNSNSTNPNALAIRTSRYQIYMNAFLEGPDWVFVGRTNYDFKLRIVTGFNTTYIAGGIKFSDLSGRQYQVYFNAFTKVFSQISPRDGISGSIRGVFRRGVNLYMNFTIMFNPDIADTLQVNPEITAESGGGEVGTGWFTSTLLFNIYNIGGLATVTSSGWAGRLYDNVTHQTYGDAFEIFAADTRTPWLIDIEGFDQNPPVPATGGEYSLDWGSRFYASFVRARLISPDKTERELSDAILYSWADYIYFSSRFHSQNGTYYTNDRIRDMWVTSHLTYSTTLGGTPYTNTSDTHLAYHSNPSSLRIKDTNTTDYSVLYLEKAFRRTIRRNIDLENVTADFWVMAPTDFSGGTMYLTDNARFTTTWNVQRRWAAIRFAPFHGVLQLQYESNLVSNNTLCNVTAGQWYHVQMVVNLGNYSVQYWVDGANVSGSVHTPTSTATSMGFFAIEATNRYNAQNDFYIDDIQVYTNWDRNYGGEARVDATFYRLQQWHQDFDLNIEQGVKYTKSNFTDQAWVAFGWDMRVNGTWVNNALWFNMTTIDSLIQGKDDWVRYNITWYQGTTKIRTDTIVGLYEGYSGLNDERGLKDLTSFHIEFWFNRMNASTIMGGRINTAYYGVSDKSPWYAFWYNDWKATAADLSSSQVFRRVLYDSGLPATVKDVDLVRPWEMIWRSNLYQYHWAIKNIDEQAFRVTSANMEGVDTPAPKKTQMPSIPQNGFASWLAAAFKGIMSAFGDAITFGAMNVWTSFVSFLDIIAGFFGAPLFFKTLFAQVGTFVGFMIMSFLMLTSMVVSMFQFLALTFVWFIWVFVRWINYLLQILVIVKGILDGTGTAVVSLGNLWTQFNMEVVITFIILLSPVMWMAKLDEEALKGNDWVSIAVGDIETIMNILSMLITFFISIVQLAIQSLFSIIEGIPIIE